MNHIREPIITRSLSRKLDTYRQNITGDVLCTPGIMTNIANKLDKYDKGLCGLYMLFNKKHVQFELEPFITPLKDRYENEICRNKICEIKQILRKYIGQINTRTTRIRKAYTILEMYEYLCTVSSLLPKLGKRFSITISQKLDELSLSYPETWFVEKMNYFKHELREYLEWGVQAIHDNTIPWFSEYYDD